MRELNVKSNQVMPVLNELYARRRVVLEFPSAEDRENFRQAIYKVKKIQDQALLDVLDERRDMLSFNMKDEFIPSDISDDLSYTKYIATLYLKEPKEFKFEIISIEELPAKDVSGNLESSQKKVPDSLGEGSSESSTASKNPSSVIQDDAASSESSVEREKPRPSE